MRPRYVALRKDGLGCRLTALANAMVLAEEFGGTFEFAWPPNENLGEFHSIWPAEEIFTASFINEYRREDLSDQFDPMEGDGPRNRNYAACRLTTSDLALLAQGDIPQREYWLTELDDYGDVFGPEWAARRYPAVFDSIGFAPEIEEVRSRARAVSVEPQACALHLRGGDIIFSTRFSNQYTRRVIPFPLAVEIGRQASAAGRQVFVFGQEKAVIDHVASAARGVPVYAIVESQKLNALQGWFFETFLMARCSRIVAGNSGFAAVAARMAGTTVTDGYSDFTAEAALNTVLGGAVDGAAVPDLHKAFAFWAVQEVYRNGLSADDRLESLRRALVHDPVNSFYRLARVTVLTEKGDMDAALAELQALVDRETASIDWSEGCLRHTLVNLRGKIRPTATRYTAGIERLAEVGAPEALLCMALIVPDSATSMMFAERFEAAEGPTARARFYSLALSKAISR